MKRVTALVIIDNHLRVFYKKPRTRLPTETKAEHVQKIHSYYVANEIRTLIEKHRDWDPVLAIEEFRYAMDTLSTSTKDPIESFKLAIAYDTATDILDMLISEGGL